jgi:hypothetical protein
MSGTDVKSKKAHLQAGFFVEDVEDNVAQEHRSRDPKKQKR